MLKQIINKGTGAGGQNTNINGLSFEIKTSIENKLIENKFKKNILNKNKYAYYYESYTDNRIVYLTQTGFRTFIKKEFDINIYKNPDEAFIIYKNNKYYIKILEKKNQNVAGSVEDKLKTGAFNKREYEKMFNNKHFIISYAFCVSNFLKEKIESNEIKYKNMKEILLEDDIKLFYGDDDNYIDIIYDWFIMI
jgi:hypothetical protein